MKHFCIAAIAAALLSGCATIVSGSSEPVTFNSDPSGAAIEVVNSDGLTVFTGTTPATTELKNGDGFFKPAEYTVTYTAAGYQPTTLQLRSDEFNNWTIGNILLGGIIGLAVDAATGAMWQFDPTTVNTKLNGGSGELQLHIVPFETLNDAERATLIPLN